MRLCSLDIHLLTEKMLLYTFAAQIFIVTGFAVRKNTDLSTTKSAVLTTETVQDTGLERLLMDERQSENVLFRLKSSETICFRWQGVSPQMVTLFHDLGSLLTINGLLEGESVRKENDTQPLRLTRLGVMLNELRVLLDPTTVVVVGAEKNEIAMRLSLQNTEGYETEYGGVSFTMTPATPVLSFLSIKFGNIIIVVEVHYLPSKPAFLKVTVPKLAAFERRKVGGILGRLWKASVKMNLKMPPGKNGKRVLSFGGVEIAMVKNTVTYQGLNQSVDCWYVSTPSVLFGDLKDYRVESLIR